MKSKTCCKAEKQNISENNPDYAPLIIRLNKVAGQIQGIKKMIENQRYCPEIITQISAAKTALVSLQSALLQGHLENCVKTAFDKKNDKDRQVKIQELIELIKKL